MSGFTNPFAQFGDFRGNAVTSDDLVTTSYLTGLPDPRQIRDEQVSLIFKQLLKRDSRTKNRALVDFSQWVGSVNGEIENTVHLAYIQMYAKLSIDVSSDVRTEAHRGLVKLYEKLGKKSSKYLKYSVCPWIVGTFDNDPRPASAAKQGLDKIFPGEKQLKLFSVFESEFIAFIYEACMKSSALTLSDERYATKEEASQKYTRLVRGCIEILINFPQLFSLEFTEISELVSTGRLWKFFSSSDSMLARISLKLAQTHLNELINSISVIWSELLRAARKNSGGPAVALDVIQLMNILTKRFPQQTWPDDSEQRKDSMASISQFVVSEPPHPARFWPLLYNLVLLVPEPPTRDLTPLYKPLERAVLKIKHNFELEESAWGCFISLSGKMGPPYVLKAFRAVEQRCTNGSIPLDAIARFLERLSDVEGVKELVVSQLRGSKCPLEYKQALAKTKKFKLEIEDSINADTTANELLALSRADSSIAFPSSITIKDDPIWIDVAIHSKTVNAQEIVDQMLKYGFYKELLLKAKPLYDHNDLDMSGLEEYVLENIENIEVCEAAVRAYPVAVSETTAVVALSSVVRVALNNESEVKKVLRFISAESETVKDLADANSSLKHDLETLAIEDSRGIIKNLLDLKLSSVKTSTTEDDTILESIDLLSLDLTVPHTCKVNPLRAPIPESTKDITNCMQLVASLPANVDLKIHPQLAIKVAVLRQYFDSWLMVCERKHQSKLEIWQDLELPNIKSQLWGLLDHENYGLAYHAAMALIRNTVVHVDDFQFDRAYFAKPSLKGAVLAYFSAIQDNQSYTMVQSSLVREALSQKLKPQEYMLIDQAFIPETASVTVDESDENAVVIIGTLGSHVTNLEELAFQSSDRLVEFAALCALPTVESASELLEYVVNVPQQTGLDRLSVFKCLNLLNSLDADLSGYTEYVDTILDTDSAFIEFYWVALQLVRGGVKPTSVIPTTPPQSLVASLIVLNFIPGGETPDIFEWLATQIRVSSNTSSIIELPDTPPAHLSSLAMNVLFNLCVKHPNEVREWYRNTRDRQFIKQLDLSLLNCVLPHIMQQLKKEVAGFPETVSINEKLREITVYKEIEDDAKVEVCFGLPEQYPGKPPLVQINNLSVSEAKKRGWLLEARQNVYNEGILSALKTLLVRINNYLDGVEPCAICYMIVNDHNKLPNKTCSQCRNLYHTDCLYQWFTTNRDKLCPMCRTPM